MLHINIIEDKGILRPNIHTSDINKHKVISNDDIRPNSITRAGIILYNYNKYGDLYFYMGIDTKSKDYTDFGGGIKKNETILKGAIREYNEETLNILMLDEKKIENSIMYYDSSMAIIFVEYNFDYDYIHTKFIKNKMYNNKYNELYDFIKIKYDNFIYMLYNTNNIYIRVNNFIINILQKYKTII